MARRSAAAAPGAAAAPSDAPSTSGRPTGTEPPRLPATYRRLVAAGVGPSFRAVARVVEVPLPAPGPGEVLVKLLYAGINGG